MQKLTDSEIRQRLRSAPQWRLEGAAIEREWKLADFASAIVFVQEVARLAEAANHHPDILVHGWNKVALKLSTHSEGGLTAADFELARQIDGLTV